MRSIILVAAAFLFSFTVSAQGPRVKNIVIVHGAFADGSGWSGVYRLLSAKGFNVVVVQNPVTSLDDDVAAVNRTLDNLSGPIILVGHSWAGVVITQAGNSDKVVGLVYVDAYQPDAGETVADLTNSAPDLTNGAILPPDANGFVYLSRDKFHSTFCADLPVGDVPFMYASQIPMSAKCFTAKVTQAAWHTKPCWAVFGTADKCINPTIQRNNYTRSHSTVTEIAGASHVGFMSHPREVAAVIEAAAEGSGK